MPWNRPTMASDANPESAKGASASLAAPESISSLSSPYPGSTEYRCDDSGSMPGRAKINPAEGERKWGLVTRAAFLALSARNDNGIAGVVGLRLLRLQLFHILILDRLHLGHDGLHPFHDHLHDGRHELRHLADAGLAGVRSVERVHAVDLDRLASSVAITVSAAEHDRDTFMQLWDVLMQHKGDRRVAIEVRDPERHLRVTIDVNAQVRVRPSERLVADVEKICGAGSVSLR